MSESTQAQLDALNLSVCHIQAQVSHLKAELAMRDAQADQAVAESLQAVNKICEGVSSNFSDCVQMNMKTGEIRLGGAKLSPPDALELSIDPGQSVPPLRMGKVTFYGETARQIREAQEVLRAAGAGQLEVVKRANERDEPYVVIDGQVFINKVAAEEVMIDPVRVEINTSNLDAAQKIMAGLNSKSGLGDQLLKKIGAVISVGQGGSLADQVRQVVREELKLGRLRGRS